MSEAAKPSGRLVAVLLAAGAARRYGAAKQIEHFDGRTLVRGAAKAALAVADALLVVSGGHAEAVEAELSGLPLRCLHNPDWALGMGHSIATAFRSAEILADDVEAALLCLADQPLVRRAQLGRLIAARSSAGSGQIIVSDYGDRRGPPCLFPARYFPELAELTGDTGARELLRRHAPSVHAIAMPEAAVDIDTPADLARLSAESGT